MTPIVSQNYLTSPQAQRLLPPFFWQPSYKSFRVILFSFASSLAVLISSLLVRQRGCNDFSWHFALLSPSEGALDLLSCRTPAEEEYCTALVCPFPGGPKAFGGCTGKGHVRRAGNVTVLRYTQGPKGWSEMNSSKTSLPMSATPHWDLSKQGTWQKNFRKFLKTAPVYLLRSHLQRETSLVKSLVVQSAEGKMHVRWLMLLFPTKKSPCFNGHSHKDLLQSTTSRCTLYSLWKLWQY